MTKKARMDPVGTLRAYRLRLYPTAEQRSLLSRSEGSARWVFNWCLASWQGWARARAIATGLSALDGREHREDAPSAYSLHKRLTTIKDLEAPWLRDVSSYCAREATIDVAAGFQRFFRVLKKHARGDHSECGVRRDGGCALGEPTFRSRSRGRRWHADQANNRETGKGPLGVEFGERGKSPRIKVSGVGWVKCAGRLPPDGARLSAIGLEEKAGRWFAALRFEAALPPYKQRVPRSVVGVETGVRELAVRSDGTRHGAVRDLRALHVAERKLRLWERRKARRWVAGKSTREQSAGWQEAVRMIQRYHLDAANARKDLLHKTSRAIVDSGAETLVMRDQAVKHMLGRGARKHEVEKRNKLAPMIQQCGGLYELRRQVEYKQAWAGGQSVTVPSDEPTTRRCSACGTVRDTEPGYGAPWKCATCGVAHDRELNAARNLRDYPGRKPGEVGGGTRRQNGRKPRTAETTEVTTAVAQSAEGSGSPRSERSGKPARQILCRGKRGGDTVATAIGGSDPAGHISVPGGASMVERLGAEPDCNHGSRTLGRESLSPTEGCSQTGSQPVDLTGGGE